MEDINIIIQIAALGVLIALINTMLEKTNNKEYTIIVNVIGLIIVLSMVIREVINLFTSIRSIFGFL